MPPLAETLMFPFFPGFPNNATTAAAVAHAAEAETAVDQPMDVSPFRQFQQLMHEKINTLRILEGPESISITNFHEVMMPIYLMSMNPDTVTNAFMEAGIHPFKRENDADVKQEAFHSKEGVTLDGHVEHSIQTVPALTVHSKVQTASSGECRHNDLAIKNHCGYSVDDLIIDKDILCAVRARARTINSSTIVFTKRDPATRLTIKVKYHGKFVTNLRK